MKHYLMHALILPAVLTGLTSCRIQAGDLINNNDNKDAGEMVSRTIEVPAPTALKATTSVNIVYTQSPTAEPVVIEAPEEYIDDITVKVSSSGELVASLNGRHNSYRIGHGRYMRVTVKAPAVTHFTANSSGDIRIVGPYRSQAEVVMTTNSSGDIKADNVAVNAIKLSSSSSGDIRIGGTASLAMMQASSSGDIKASKLAADEVRADASSSGDINCYAISKLTFRESSSGEVKFSTAGGCEVRKY